MAFWAYIKKVLTACFVLICVGCLAYAEEPRTVSDSLYKLLNTKHLDTTQVISLLHKSKPFRQDSSLFYIQKAYQLAQLLQHPYSIAHTQLAFGEYYQEVAHFSKAEFHLLESLEIYDSLNDQHAEAIVMGRLGFTLVMLGNFEKALSYSQKALVVNQKLNRVSEIAQNFKTLGIVYSEQEDYREAINFFQKAQQIYQNLNEPTNIANCTNNIGKVYYLQRNYNQALVYHQLTLQIRQQQRDTLGIANSFVHIGNSHLQKQKYQLAAQAYNQALRLRQIVKDTLQVAYSFKSFANLHFQTHKYPQAIEYAQKSIPIFKKMGVKAQIKECYEILYKCYASLQDFQEAYRYQNEYIKYEDSLYSEAKIRAFAQLKATMLLDEQEKQILSHKQENELLRKEKAIKEGIINQYYLLGIMVTGALVSTLIFYVILYRRKRKIDKINNLLKKSNTEVLEKNQEITKQREQLIEQAEELRESYEEINALNTHLESLVSQRTAQLQNANNELDAFLYHTAHDLRRPLLNFFGICEVARMSVKEAEALQLFEMTRQNAAQMDKMLYKLRSISNIYNEEYQYGKINIQALLDDVIRKFEQEIKDKHIDYRHYVYIAKEFHSNTYPLGIILENLIENAIHFAAATNPYLFVNIFSRNNQLVVQVKDNGEGIPSDQLANVMTMYHRASESSTGNGLGLYVVKTAAENMQGEVQIESTEGKGTTVTVFLPLFPHQKNKPAQQIWRGACCWNPNVKGFWAESIFFVNQILAKQKKFLLLLW